jgi:hypothetical protein
MLSRRIELLPATLILLIAVAKLAAELMSFDWDWDIDHRMYFGGRLLAGDLPWTVEFDDKLPVVQALFALPAEANSIRVWQIMSALAVFAGCVAAFILLVNAIRDYFPGVQTSVAKTVAFYSAALIACLFALLPGGLTHINPMAASLAIISIASVDVARREFPNSRRRFYGAYLLGAFSASVAIGIRPYFICPLVLAGVWAALKVEGRLAGHVSLVGKRRLTIVQVLFWTICWIACTGFFGLATNAFPYFGAGRLDALLAGLDMLSQDLSPQIMASLVLETQYQWVLSFPELIVFFFALWGVTIVLLPFSVSLSRIWHSKHTAALDITYLVILCPLLLEMSILTKHFWAHYLQLFVPFMGFGVGLLGANLVAMRPLHLSRRKMLWLVTASSIAIVVSARETIASSFWAISHSSSLRHSQSAQLATFERYLRTRPERERDFLNPSQMYFHWQLKEPRHGFPHAANTDHIVSKGWWHGVKVPERLDLPTDRDSYCKMLETKGPSLVVEVGLTKVIDCFLQNPDSKYSRVYLEPIPVTTDITATNFCKIWPRCTTLFVFERMR